MPHSLYNYGKDVYMEAMNFKAAIEKKTHARTHTNVLCGEEQTSKSKSKKAYVYCKLFRTETRVHCALYSYESFVHVECVCCCCCCRRFFSLTLDFHILNLIFIITVTITVYPPIVIHICRQAKTASLFIQRIKSDELTAHVKTKLLSVFFYSQKKVYVDIIFNGFQMFYCHVDMLCSLI